MTGCTRHVRGALWLALTLGLAGSLAAQQQQTGTPQQRPPDGGIVEGQVVLAGSQRPLAGAQVFIVGAQLGALSNSDGKFVISGVPAGPRTVRFQSVGYGNLERQIVVANQQTVTVNFAVLEQPVPIDQIVVTAMGIERAQRSLGYAVQSVRSAQLERSPEVNFINALAGQTAGTQTTLASGQPGSSTRLTIRGESSFRGDGQPLYVIDGVPISVDVDPFGVICFTPVNNVLPCSDSPDNPILRGEAGGRAMDLDPSTIEEISILRGAAATALYGSRAALGAVVIRTKQGTPGSPMHFTLSSRFGQEEPILQGLQTAWGAGVNGFFCNGKPAGSGGWCEPGAPAGTDPLTNLSWGPHRDSVNAAVAQHEGALRYEDPRSDFYKTGATSAQSIYATGSMPLGTYGLGFGYTKQDGVFTKSTLDRLNLNANVSLILSSWLRTHTTIFFANTGNDRGFEGLQGFTSLVSLLPPTRDLRVSTNPDGTPVMFGNNNPHPQWLAENEYASSNTARWITAQTMAFTLGKGFTLSDQISLDSYLDERRDFQNERPWLTLAGVPNGGTRQQKITRRTFNNDLVLTMDQRPLGSGPFTISGLLGTNIYSAKQSDVNGIGKNLGIPGYYNIGNFSFRTVNGSLDAKRRLVGLYSQATLDYKNWAYLTLTGRDDWSSTLPRDANSYFYPSASLAVVFTDALKMNSPLLDYGKLRFSVSKVGTDAPPYRLTSSYVSGAFQDFGSGTTTFTNVGFPFRSARGFVIDNNYGNPDIKPESAVETELGLETLLLGGHARVDLSVYNRSSYDQIFSVPVAASSGFTTVTENAGDLRNRGIELSIGATPIRSEKARVDAQVNLTRNWSKVIDLTPEVPYLYLGGVGTTAILIHPDYGYGVIWGTRYQRNPQGQLLIGTDGFPLVDSQPGMLGEIAPTWLANFSTSARYRAFGVSALLDIRHGGDILNADLHYTIPAGTAKITEQRNDNYTFKGVSATSGQPNNVSVVRNQAFWTRYAAVDENLVEHGNVVRLREATVSVSLPQRLSRIVEMQNLSLYVSGRNLKVWTPFSYGDPDASNYGAVNAGGGALRMFTVPNTRTWSFGVRASY